MRAEKRSGPGSGEFQTFEALHSFMVAFENGSLPRSRWNHAAQLAISMWYLSLLPTESASARVIAGIRAYHRAQGIRITATSGYHETVTLFWLRVTHRFLTDGRKTNVLDRVNAFVRAYREDEKLVLEYYSPEVLRSWKARTSWADPDLKPLDP